MGRVKVYFLFFCVGLFCLAAAPAAAKYAPAMSVDWNGQRITATGYGVPPQGLMNVAQGKLLARRAAIVDAYRMLGEQVNTIRVDAETVVQNYVVNSDVVRTKMTALLQGATITDEKMLPDGIYQVTVQLPLFGEQQSLANTLFKDGVNSPQQKEDFPLPSVSGALNSPAQSSVPYTGLIVDCSGRGLSPVMSPVIYNEAQ